MANATINTTYVGQLATPFVAPAILSADSIAKGYISVLENVRHEAVLKKFSGGAIGDRTCEFTTAAGQLVLSDVTLTTAQLQVNEQVCNYQLAQDWAAAQMRGASAGCPANYAAYLSQYVAKIVSADVENNMWDGNFDPLGAGGVPAHTSFNGIMYHYFMSAQTYQSGTAGAWTGDSDATTGVMTHLAAAAALIPDPIVGDPDTKLFMSRKTAQLYYQGLAATYTLPFLNDGLVARYSGYDIVTPAGFPDDCVVFSKVENLYFGTNVLTDMIEARMLDLTGVTGDAVTRVAMLFDAGTQIVDEASMCSVYRTS